MNDLHPQVTLPNTEVRVLQSAFVDQQYQLFIKLPTNYHSSQEKYPVLYVTDANWYFSCFCTLSMMLPPMIIVGIGYPTDDFAEIWRIRGRDFLAAHNEEDEHRYKEQSGLEVESGGGDRFLSFIRDELFPFVTQSYRVIEDDRAFFGHSWGGNFGIYTLFQKPDTFNKYVIGAPDLGWDNEVVFEYEKRYSEKYSDLPVKLYLAVGTLDEGVSMHPNVSTLFRLHALLKSHNYKGLEMSFDVLKDETHASSSIISATSGLRFIYLNAPQ